MPRPWPKPFPRTTIATGGSASADAFSAGGDVTRAVTARDSDRPSAAIRREGVRCFMKKNARRFGRLIGGAPRLHALELQHQLVQMPYLQGRERWEFGSEK